MSTNPNKLDWKIAATVGAIAGVGIGGFAFASPDDNWFPTPEGVILQDNANSVPRLSAPVVVPTTVKQLASAASVTIPPPAPIAELSAPSPVSPAEIPVAPEALAPAPAIAPPPPVALDVDSPMSAVSPVSVASPVSPMSAVSVASAVSPMSPVSVASAPSPASPSSPGSGAGS